MPNNASRKGIGLGRRKIVGARHQFNIDGPIIYRLSCGHETNEEPRGRKTLSCPECSRRK